MTNMATGQDQKAYEKLRQLAATTTDSRFTEAVAAYETARIDGLCHDGAWECALAALGPNVSEIILASKSAQK